MTQDKMNSICEKLNAIICPTRESVFAHFCELAGDEWTYYVGSRNSRTVHIRNESTGERLTPHTTKHADGYDLVCLDGKTYFDEQGNYLRSDFYVNPLYRI